MIVYCRIIDLANSSVKFIIYPAAIDVMLSSSSRGFYTSQIKGKV
jgi:hypothetical protein